MTDKNLDLFEKLKKEYKSCLEEERVKHPNTLTISEDDEGENSLSAKIKSVSLEGKKKEHSFSLIKNKEGKIFTIYDGETANTEKQMLAAFSHFCLMLNFLKEN